MQVTIARQLGLEPTTVGNFFMNARRRSMDKWKDETLGESHSSKSSPQPHNTGQTVVQVGQSAQQQQASSLQQQTVTIHTTDSLWHHAASSFPPAAAARNNNNEHMVFLWGTDETPIYWKRNKN